ncbi:hypothetical protein C475_21409 [Halosimplex carlsbadense 2-9-1]|uniref:Uncharacterized protein n=1 Tax=Halosimplex carlsbadense 2-9-1 TaxID=797114 RepID=M0CB80_9EURY|nr:hypothetical protein [Halosimplex carlsbadense]ELZ19898.1 hypothetical protein C475_21409 [Halosimplex carlsbadense 2-9-1]
MADLLGLSRRYTATAADRLNSVYRRLKTNRFVSWILFTGARPAVTLVLLCGVFALFVALALLRPFDIQRLLSDTNTLQTLFTTLLSGAILIVSVVSSISSIVLSQEITDIETEQSRIDASIDFRRRAETLAEVEGSPSQPAAFLEVILYSIYREARALQRTADDCDDEEFSDQLHALAEEVVDEARAAAETLDGARFGTFTVLSAGLNYDYSWQLNTARRLRNRYEDDLDDHTADALQELIDTLKFFATGREYFQSLYYKREVARLSSNLLYVSLPVIVFISYLLLALNTNIIPIFRIGPLTSLPVFVMFAYTVSLAPYVVLTAYVIRVAAITLKTLAAGPFLVRQPQHDDIVELQVEIEPESWDDRPDDREGDEFEDGDEDTTGADGSTDDSTADDGRPAVDGGATESGTDASND